ncbi:VOC family protein [Streptomyces sp. H27-C3]|uniref:VOC family protein n=1 Tax=Streptomyces sp. H27-C3 TaxID=3046305 RepID=UPI0024BA01D1|nr:VOC family protein [Streptomyces sp. H27-C3]MDJ0460116.1 VOC family protein [Streptomyces sp. H27-C3]
MDTNPTGPTATGAMLSQEIFGAPCWITLMARDLRASQSFYGAVLGWQFQRARLGDEFSVALLDGTPVAGIGALAPALRAPVAWTPYFAVVDVDETAARIRERSATVAVGPLRFPVGRGALAADRDGAVFGIWEGQLVSDWQSWRKNAPAWLRLRARDAFEAAIFYGEVLDWACGRPGCCEVDYEAGDVVLRQGGDVVAHLGSGANGAALEALIQPRWHVYFPVSDVERTVQAALHHGGSVLGRESDSTGAEATLCDPDGAVFTVTTRSRG